MTETPWTPDLDVAVHDGELIVHFDHLRPMEQVHAEMEDGGVALYGVDEVHCLHVPLPEAVDFCALDLRSYDGMFELRMLLQG